MSTQVGFTGLSTEYTPDTLEDYFDSRIDLVSRKLAKRRESLQLRLSLGGILRRTNSVPAPEALSEHFEREMSRLQLKVSSLSSNSD